MVGGVWLFSTSEAERMGSLKRLNMGPQLFAEGNPTLRGFHGEFHSPVMKHPQSFPINILEELL